MNYQITLNRIVLLVFIFPFAALQLVAAAERIPSVYVCEFMYKDRTTDETVGSLASDFEIALRRTGKFRILERRSLDQLEYQRNLERGVSSGGLSPDNAKSGPVFEPSDFVIFGEVYNDAKSGEIWVTITEESWRGEKLLMEKIDIKPGRWLDAQTRGERMEALATKFVGSAAAGSLIARTASDLPRSQVFEKLVFTLIKCERPGDNLVCELELKAIDNFRPVSLYAKESKSASDSGLPISKIATQYGVFHAGRIAAGKYSSSRFGITFVGISPDEPVKIRVEFYDVPANVSVIDRLDIFGQIAPQNVFGGGPPGKSFAITFEKVSVLQ